ncbi:MAG: ABC transporter permease subunit [Saprospiraceae bacterium]|nr:ABC transporter permease [Bacteroidia bacterium]NNK90538.1 ABC transporter permease subunit [Saprospiraceae bacterium]
MLRLIKLEWSKFSKNTIIVLLFIFFILFFPASLYIGKLMPDLPSFLPGREIFFNFPTVWEYLGYAGNWTVFFFLGVLVIYTVTIEVNNKTMRQSIINGLSRNEFFASKMINIVLLSTFATLFYCILSLGVGFINGENESLSSAFDNDYAIPRFFLMSFSYMNFAIFLALIFRKSGIAVFLYLTYVMIIEMILRWVVHMKIDNSELINYYPMNVTEDLMPFPFLRYADFIQNNEIEFPILLTTQEAVLATLAYSFLFLSISYITFMRRDI